MISRLPTLFAGLTVVLLSAIAGAATMDDEIRERLRPAGSVCVLGEQCAAGLGITGGVSGGTGGSRNAETIYNTFCMVCHATGVSESPVLGNLEQWQPRIDKGIDVLYANSINGINVMPPRGTCIDCSDDEIRATVDYMLQASQ